ncbi:MAG TPA: hypothetical protein VNK48_02465 [Xanthobacteraceae bacterium]|jgi:hypothetical protein|nr:hypothetical protein [Xanthobacteraceae bacterium]
MSKAMFVTVLVCSMLLYNPTIVRDFARQHGTQLGMYLKSTLITVDRLMPGFMRFSRG